MEPLIRRRIREIRGRREPLLSTSGLYATVVEEVIIEGLEQERTEPGEGARGGPFENLPGIIRDSVTRARRTVTRWRHAERSSRESADRTEREPLSPLDQADFRRTMERIIAGLAREDREILYLRMKGNSWAAVAEATGMRDIACRQRWVRLVAELRRVFPDD